MKFNTAILIVASLFVFGCNQSTHSAKEASPDPIAVETDIQSPEVQAELEKSMSQSQTMTGTIVYKELEGGFYAFVASTGENFILTGINPDYIKTGIVLEISGTPKPDVMTTTMFGTVFEVEHAIVVDDTNASSEDGATH